MTNLTEAERMILKGLKDRLVELSAMIQALELQQMDLVRLKKARNYITERVELMSQGQIDFEDRTPPVDYHESFSSHAI